jgi:hypothetical protein
VFIFDRPMATDTNIFLLLTAAAVAFVHTLAGPDHYLPFNAMARAFQWSRGKMVAVTLLCGVGHVLGSVGLALIGIAAGAAIGSLQAIQSVRGQIAAWALLSFGLVYLAWGLRRASRHRPHAHIHVHADGVVHSHIHQHEGEHLHPHPSSDRAAARAGAWMMFTVFLLGPCEPLIPLLIIPAAQDQWPQVLLVTAVFAVVTLATMAAAVLLCDLGVRRIRPAGLERYSHALAGAMVTLCAVGILALGL